MCYFFAILQNSIFNNKYWYDLINVDTLILMLMCNGNKEVQTISGAFW
jgi:hypothetical protein